MIKKTNNAILIILLILSLFVSCGAEPNIPQGEVTNLNLTINTGSTKELTFGDGYSSSLAVASFKYTAICTTSPSAEGVQNSWTTLTTSGSGNSRTATLSRLGRGTWTIRIRAYNSNGGLLSEGSSNVVLNSNNQNLSINLVNTNGTGTVAVTLGVTVPSLENGSIQVKYVTLSNIDNLATGSSMTTTPYENYKTSISGSTIIHSTSDAGKTGYVGTVNLAPGLYAMSIIYSDNGSSIAGQALAFRVVEGSPFAINGELSTGEYVDFNLSTISLDTQAINVTVTNAAAVSNGNLTCTVSASGGTGYTYTWYLDGVAVAGQTSATYNKAYNDKGSHTLSCIVRGTVNGTTSAGYASSAFSGDYRGDIYTVAFNANKPTGAPNDVSGSMASQTFKVNTAQNLTRNVFSLTGFDFVGWATSASGVKVYNDMQSVNNIASAGATLTLYAKWTGLVAITLDPNGGTMGGSTSNVVLNGTYEANYPISNYETGGAYVPLKTGMIFVGWDASN